jgi:surface antigen
LSKRNKTKINIKARLNRHLRIIKESFLDSNKKVIHKKHTNNNYNIAIFIVLLIVPIYPTLASFMYNTSRYEFYRWDIDESSIIESYFWGDDVEEEMNLPILESTDSFISVNTILDDERDLAWTNEILDYEVKRWESFYSISYKFRVSTNSIYWANDFSKNHTLQPGEIIKVPPVTGIIHQVKSGDTVWAIAKKYDIEESKIVEQNRLEDGWLITWEVIVIPGAIKIVPKPVYKKPTTTYTKKTTPARSSSQYVAQSGQYKLVWRKPYSWVWWNCTYYVASYKNVNWRWNANQWIRNAEAKWHPTWQTPTVWSIVQFTGRWYNPKYGHVGIVMDVTSTHIIVSDMNYRRLNEVTYRKVLKNDRTIDWYIYVD